MKHINRTQLKIAGLLNLLTALVHTILGQQDLVTPLLVSELDNQVRAEWMGAWHMITLLLFFTSYVILKSGFGSHQQLPLQTLKTIGWIYVLSGLPFIVSSIYFSVLAPQWILIIPIGLLLVLSREEAKLTV